MRNLMRNRVKEKKCSAASQDAIFHALMINPRKRISVDDLFVHRWIGGKNSELNMGGEDGGGGKEGDTKDSDISNHAAAEKKVQGVPGLGISAVEPGQEKLMRRSQSANDVKSVNLAKQLSKPPTPRRLPPLDTVDHQGGEGKDGSTNGNGGGVNGNKNLRINAIMANNYNDKQSSTVLRIQEPLSPALSDAAMIMNKGDAILAQFKADSAAGSGGGGGGGTECKQESNNDEGKTSSTPERLGSSSPERMGSPLGR